MKRLFIYQERRPNPLKIILVPRVILYYPISSPELKMLASVHTSASLTLSGVAFGAFVSFLITLLTVRLDNRAFATFLSLFVVSCVLLLYFAANAYRDLRAAEKVIREIRSSARSVPSP